MSSYFDSHLGGLELVAGRLARELAKSGISVTWLAADLSPPPNDETIQPAPVPVCNLVEDRVGLPLPLPLPSAFRAINRAVEASDVVMVHDTLYLTSIAALHSARRHGKPTLVLQHIGDALFESALVQKAMQLAERVVTRPSLAAADQVVYISHTVAAHFGGLRLQRDPVVSLSGIDTLVFRPPADTGERTRLRQGFGFGDASRVALYAGRFVGKKGIESLRELALLRPDLEIVLAGGGPVDPEGWRLSNVRVFRGLSGETLADLYRSADVFVLPSPSESFSLVIREALATGLPVVCGEQAAATDPEASHYLEAVRLVIGEARDNARRLAAGVDRALAAPSDDRAAFARGRYDWAPIARLFRDRIEQIHRAPGLGKAA